MRRQRRRTPQQEEEKIQQEIGKITIELPVEDEIVENETNRRSLKDFVLPGTQESQTSIARPMINTNNFEIKPLLIQIVQQFQFRGNVIEDPNMHLVIFLEVCDAIKMNVVSKEAIRLKLVTFSLRDKVKSWIHSHAAKTFNTWDESYRAFLNK